jgi:hypothetical protein
MSRTPQRGTVTYDSRTVTLAMPDAIAAHPGPGMQQWLGEVAHDDCIPGGGNIRLELPDGSIVEGQGSVDATHSLGRSWLKINIRVPVEPLTRLP